MLITAYNLIVRGIFSIVAGLVGGAGALLPPAVKEHFFASRQRMLSFIMLLLIINGIAKLFFSAMISFL